MLHVTLLGVENKLAKCTEVLSWFGICCSFCSLLPLLFSTLLLKFLLLPSDFLLLLLMDQLLLNIGVLLQRFGTLDPLGNTFPPMLFVKRVRPEDVIANRTFAPKNPARFRIENPLKIPRLTYFPPWWTRFICSRRTSLRGNLIKHLEHGVQASFCITFGWLTLIWATLWRASENSQLHAEHLKKSLTMTKLSIDKS